MSVPRSRFEEIRDRNREETERVLEQLKAEDATFARIMEEQESGSS